MRQKHIRVLIDSSVLVSGALSPNGGSAVILSLASNGLIDLILTEMIVKESRLGIKKKYGSERLMPFYNIVSKLKNCVFSNPNRSEIAGMNALIVDKKDRHILAGAIKYCVDVLVTLDKKHFFTNQLEESNLSFVIQTPGQFLKRYRGEEEQSSKLLDD